MPADLRTDRSGHGRSRPPKQSVARSSPYGDAGGFWRPRTRRKMSRTRVSILVSAHSSRCIPRHISSAWNLAASTF